MQARRVAVTGATGFVGRFLVPRLRESGHDLVLSVRRPAPDLAGPGVRVAQVGPIGPATRWDDALAGCDAVIHLAAHVHVAPERAQAEAELFDAVNHRGTLALFEASVRAGVGLFVFLSSINAVGSESRPGHPLDEATRPAPDTPYGRSKLAAEEALRARAEGSATRLVILRPPLVCGPGVGGNLASLLRLAALPLPLPLGGLANRRTLLSLANLASAILHVLERPIAGMFGLGDAAPVSTSAIVRHLREGLGRRTGLLPAPAALIRAAASLAGRPGLARRLLGDLEVDSSAFRAAYGFRDALDTPTALREAAAASLATGAGAASRRGSDAAPMPKSRSLC